MVIDFNYQQFLFEHGVKVATVIAGSYILYRLLSFFKNRIIKILMAKKPGDDRFRDRRVKTISGVIMNTGLMLIVLIATLMILRELGMDPSPILASAGIFGLAISLGAQALTKDVIAGLIILAENQYSEGDMVKLDEVTGEVDHITLRKTVLLSDKGACHHIPNGQIKVVTVLMPGKKSNK